jgi:hypothetical protein
MKSVESQTPASQTKANSPFFQERSDQRFFRPGRSDSPFFPKPSSQVSPIQTKLTVGQPNDIYEKEADAAADKIVQRMSEPGAAPPPSVTPLTNASFVHEKCAHCEQEEQLQMKPIFESEGEIPEGGVQRKCAACEREHQLQKKSETGSQSTATPAVESSLKASKGSGSPLPDATRTQMEGSFGADLSQVRIHDNPNAAAMNKSLHAQAFTHGNDVFFSPGKYNTGSKDGQHLLAHELTHVLQQNPGLRTKSENYPHLTHIQRQLDGLQQSGPELQAMLETTPAGLGIQKLDIPGISGIADYLNIELPSDPIEAIEKLLSILQDPKVHLVVSLIPGIDSVIMALQAALNVYKFIKYVIDNKDKIIAEIQKYIENKLDEVEPQVKEKLQQALGFLDHRHFIAIWQAHLLPMLQHLKDNWWQTIKDTLWEQVWPFEGLTTLTDKAENRKGLGKDLGDLYDTFVKGWHDLKNLDDSKFVDDILLFEKGLTGLANRFYGWVAIIIVASETLAGTGIAGFFSGGALSAPGAAAGFGAGLATAGSIGEGLLAATVVLDAAILIKSILSLHDFDSMLVDEQQFRENNEYYKQIASSSLSLTLTGVMVALSYLGGKIAEALLGKVVKFLPKSLQEVLENIKIGMKGGKPGGKSEPLEVEKNPPELNGEFGTLREAIKSPDNIKTVTDPDLVGDYDVEVRAGDHIYRRSKLNNAWCRFSDPVCGIKLDDINAAVDKSLGLDVAAEVKPGDVLTVPYKGGKASAEVISVDDQFVKIKVRSKSASSDITQSIPKERFNQMLKDGQIIRWSELRAKWMKNRPAYREGLVDDVWNAAKQADGKVYDPDGKELTWDQTKSRFDQWHMGHKPGKEYSKLVDDLVEGKINEEEFLKQYNDAKNYRPEDPTLNMSHARENREAAP